MTVRRGAFGEIHQLRSEINRLIEALLEEPGPTTTGWQPPLDVIDEEDRYRVEVELPGVSAGEVTVELRDQTLLVRGHKGRPAGEPEAHRYQVMERYVGAFEARAELPGPVLTAGSRATLADGVLTVVAPKLGERRHRAFTIPVHEEDPGD